MKMRSRISKPLVLTFAMVLCASSALAQSETRSPELPNFHQVNERLYRGAQPSGEGLRKLSALGVRTIINLRAADEHSRAEEAEARAAGLRYFNIPMEGFDRPRQEQIERALSLINDEANQPVFVHCKRGADRTGTLIAIYRISHDGWTSEEAISEAKRYGLSWLEFRMKDYIRDYGRDHAAQQPGPQHDKSNTHPAGRQNLSAP